MLDEKAQSVAQLMHGLNGASDVQLRSPPLTAMLQIHLNLDQLIFRGISPGQVMSAIQTAYEGRIVGKNIQGNRIYNVAVNLPPELRNQAEFLRQLPLKNAEGQRVLLEQVADIRHTEGRYNILHQGAQRVQTVTCKIDDRDMDEFMQELKNRVLNEIDWSQSSSRNLSARRWNKPRPVKL